MRYTRHRMCLLDGRVSDDRYRLFASTFKPVSWTYTGAKALTVRLRHRRTIRAQRINETRATIPINRARPIKGTT